MVKTSISTAIFISAALGTKSEYELEKVIPHLKSLGYEGIEILPYDPLQINVSSVKNILRDQMEISAIATGAISFNYKATLLDLEESKRLVSLNLLERYIDLAYELEAANVLIGSVIGKIKSKENRTDSTKWLVEGLRRSCEYARKLGVTLAIEPINRYERNFLNTVEEGLNIIKLVNSDNIHLLLDTFHMNIEERSIEYAIKIAGEEVVHVHVADSNRWPPGYGHLDFESIINALNEIGYDGYLSIECLPKPDLDTALRKSIDNLKYIIAITDKDSK
ncbi:MAG: TIM barrel protein [Candidatus Hodarchaeota archaeon]